MAAMRRLVIGNSRAAPTRQFSTSLKTLHDELPFKPGGRVAVSGSVATIFGAGGFLGRYVVNRLARQGTQCIVPYRGDGMDMRHLKLSGDLGQVVPVPIDFVDEDSIRATLKRSNVVINLIGNDYETNNYSYHDTNVKVTYRLAKLAAESGLVKKFIHVSQLGADVDSPSELLRTKAEGEQVVRDFFPDSTIVRPAPIFGHEDRFLNTLAQLVDLVPFMPVVNAQQVLQPVYVLDVAQAIVNCMISEDAPGSTVYACGPEKITREELVMYICDNIYCEDYAMINIPAAFARFLGKINDMTLPVKFRALTQDGVDQQGIDMVQPRLVGTDLDLKALQITPRSLQQEGSSVLLRHRGSRKPLKQVNYKL